MNVNQNHCLDISSDDFVFCVSSFLFLSAMAVVYFMKMNYWQGFSYVSFMQVLEFQACN